MVMMARGLTPVVSIDIDATADTISATPCHLRGYHIFNNSAAAAFFKFYNKTGATGSDTPLMTIGVAAGAAGHINWGPDGIKFPVACSVRATTAIADADTGDPGTGACSGTFLI